LQLVDLMCDIVTLDIIILPKLKEFDCYYYCITRF